MDLKLLLLPLFALSAVVGLEIENVMNGEDVVITDYPYNVQLLDKEGLRCGGVLIYPDIVLTAAHCFINSNLTSEWKHKSYGVLAGSDNYHLPGGFRIRVAHTYLHPNYTFKRGEHIDEVENDIAILKLEYKFPVAKGSNINTIKLPNKNDVFNGKIATFTGFGSSEYYIINRYGKGDLTGRLRKLNVKILSDSECSASINASADLIYCVKNARGRGICKGDSGSPYVIGNEVVGINSLGPHICDVSDLPNRLTKVSAYIDWIEEILGEIEKE